MVPPMPPRFPPRYAPREGQGVAYGSMHPHAAQVHPWHAAAGLGGIEAIFALVTVVNLGPLTPFKLTVVGPRGWPLGTWTINCVGVADNTAARFGPNRITSLDAFVSNPLPLI